MKHPKLFILNIIAVLILFNCSNEPLETENTIILDPTEYYEELNISYGADANQKFDLYLPANRTNSTKIMFLIHGGGWSSGDKGDMNAIKDLIRQDFPNLAIVNINYRLADANTPPFPHAN